MNEMREPSHERPMHTAMPAATSVFLDLLRIAAAFTVFVHHCAQFWNARIYEATTRLAHSAVVVFFVLSGYVIAWSTLSRGRDARRYASARLARLYSVVIPALVLTGVLYFWGSSVASAFYLTHSRGH